MYGCVETPARLSVCLLSPEQRRTPNTSYVDGVVSLVADLLPASWASVSILKGIAEALATEDMATFCRDNETSVLHNLENRKNSLPVCP